MSASDESRTIQAGINLRKIQELQARVKELEVERKRQDEWVAEVQRQWKEENARLLEQCNTYRSDFGKMVKVVDAAMELIDQPGMSCYVDSQHRQRDFFERLDNLAKAVACVAYGMGD